MPRFVVKPAEGAGTGALTDAHPLDDTGLFVAEAPDPRALVEGSDQIAWAAPAEDETEGAESYPTGEVSIRFEGELEGEDLDSFIDRHGLELRRRNEFVPEQVVVAPAAQPSTWLPDVVERLNADGAVAKAWPNTLSRYRR